MTPYTFKQCNNPKVFKKWTKKEVCLVIECLRYAQRGDFTSKKEADIIDDLCERINLGETYSK